MKSILLLLTLVTISCKTNIPMTDKTEHKITTQLEIIKSTFQLSYAIPIQFSVKNNTNITFEFCYWQTPLEKEFTADFFEIVHDGKIVPYTGRMIKQKPPSKENIIKLEPEETSTQIINVNDGYTLNKSGTYTLRFLGRTINGLPDSEPIDFIINN